MTQPARQQDAGRVRRRAGRACSLLACGAVMLGARAAEAEVAPETLARFPPLDPAAALAGLVVRPGFRVELAAAEPEVVDPVAFAFDERGRLYVVEMRDYSERRPERLGRVRRLEDRDGDGRFETSTVFLDGLPWPTAVACWDGGVFVGTTPDLLFAKDTDGDGRADVRETVFTGFAGDTPPERLNVQTLVNSLQWGPDARLHGATGPGGGRVRVVDTPFTRAWRAAAGLTTPPQPPLDLDGRDFSFDPRTLELRAEPGGGQHGMTFDDAGRKFVCSNSDHLQWIAFNPEPLAGAAAGPLPPARRSIAADGPAAPVFRISPDEPWRVLRTRWRVTGLSPGLIEGGGRASGYFTSATGLTIYRGDAYGEAFAGDAFVADCGSNLIHRKKITARGAELAGERPADEAGREFLASRDTWFRPVQFANGPDGCLWFADMYREVIEHPWSLPPGIKEQLDLNAGNDRGRLYRIVPEGASVRRRVDLSGSDTARLAGLLDHPNGWHRDTAARLLHQRRDPAAPGRVEAVARHGTNAPGRLAALRLLGAWGALTEDALRQGLRDGAARVRAAAVTLVAEKHRGGTLPAGQAGEFTSRAEDVPEVQLALVQALAVVKLPERAAWLAKLAAADGLPRDLALATAGEDAAGLWRTLLAARPPAEPETLVALAGVLGRRGQAREVRAALADAEQRLPEANGLRVAAALATALPAAARDVAADSGWATWLARARSTAAAAGPAQVPALRLLARLAPEDAALRLALRVGQPAAAQEAAVNALLASPPADHGAVLGAWESLAPPARQAAVAGLLRTTPGTAALLAALESGRLDVAALAAAQVEALRRHADPGVQARARRLLGAPAANRDAAIAARLGALRLEGDTGRGREVFLAQCASCHRHGGEGHALGPGVESFAALPPETLLVAILDPNREVAPTYFVREIETAEGELLTGLPGEAPPGERGLRLAGGQVLTVPEAAILRESPTGRSLMPEGFEATLTDQQLADLIAWIRGGR